jgi:hypothetical protein
MCALTQAEKQEMNGLLGSIKMLQIPVGYVRDGSRKKRGAFVAVLLL